VAMVDVVVVVVVVVVDVVPHVVPRSSSSCFLRVVAFFLLVHSRNAGHPTTRRPIRPIRPTPGRSKSIARHGGLFADVNAAPATTSSTTTSRFCLLPSAASSAAEPALVQRAACWRRFRRRGVHGSFVCLPARPPLSLRRPCRPRGRPVCLALPVCCPAGRSVVRPSRCDAMPGVFACGWTAGRGGVRRQMQEVR
jgi:hypothetical protein